MNREEQISQASYDCTGEYSNSEFHWGVEWADEHPKEGFWDKAKVIEWLYDNFWDYLDTDYLSDFEILRKARVGDMIEDLCKAMDE